MYVPPCVTNDPVDGDPARSHFLEASRSRNGAGPLGEHRGHQAQQQPREVVLGDRVMGDDPALPSPSGMPSRVPIPASCRSQMTAAKPPERPTTRASDRPDMATTANDGWRRRRIHIERLALQWRTR